MKHTLLFISILELVFILILLNRTKDRIFTYEDVRMAYHDGCEVANGKNCVELADFFKETLIDITENW